MLHDSPVSAPAGAKRRTKRLTVAFDLDDLARLEEIRTAHRPEMSMPYVIQYAVHQLVERLNADQDATKRMGDPLGQSDS